MNAPRYSYAVVPLDLMIEVATVPLENGAFVSSSQGSERVRSLLAEGYRWIRSENDKAILELTQP